MEVSGLQCDTMAHPTELLITCTNADTQLGESELELEDASQQQISALTEQYHFIDQDGNAIRCEIQALPGTSPQMMILASESENGQVFHVNVIPSNQTTTAQFLIPQDPVEHSQTRETLQTVQNISGNAVPENTGSLIIHSSTALDVSKKSAARLSVEQFPKPLPSNLPVWARRLRSCEKIGDSYRGYCLSEAELMNILGLHKQHTMSVWGTRQSPSPAKPATRLMWKSQYVPYDGIPFINAGSRAIVMECQYGPRRKGSQPKKSGEIDSTTGQMYKATCPARIYIKKVKKFPSYRVPTDPKIDKKLIKLEQEKAFNLLKKDLETIEGVLRWYVQLPDQEAHQYHNLDSGCFSSSPTSFQPPNEEEDEMICEESSTLSSRLHPCVSDKIRELVAKGIDEVYSVRKQLRKFVERELFKPDEIPERHNLSYFPTVNDLKNHIHEAQKALGNGELIYEQETIPRALQWSTESGSVLNEMVTVTFESSSHEEQESLIKVQNCSNEDDCQDTAQLLSSLTSLQPKIFAQLQSLQLQPTFTSPDGTTALIAVNQPSPTFTSDETSALMTVNSQMPSFNSDGTTALITVNHPPPSFTTSEGTTALIAVNRESPSFTSSDGTTSLITVSQPGMLNAGTSNQPLVLSHLQSQQNDSSASAVTALSPSGHNHLVSMGQLVTVEDPTSSVSGEVHQILLGELHPIPIRILDNQPTIVEVGSIDEFCTVQDQDSPRESTDSQSHTEETGSTDCQDPA
ncbi:calcium-responsive transcription factor [Hyla sarda]|uniref:calcium-responsive transcription factor n=1 Tax=Hyla sarda TaxID=327740 RepID=UPI0024C2B030|nr:calcium-responsive transcription factor [Hyla sarda]XP_056389877.1 calcium-responsive transcription factor [Hyla sarda]XP_056389878.1 calcium-responsive transcription factor [Hyla sarda]